MSKPFIQSINYMRGLCMLGVIGIHAGSYSLTNAYVNTALVALFEILSRFSVPAFFFLSAFGMFYSQPLREKFNYSSFIRRRARTVFFPYLCWSGIYIAYLTIVSHSFEGWSPVVLWNTLLYGLACYHIYFLVILLWFYALMPFWRLLLLKMMPQAKVTFTILFVLNVWFNFESAYLWSFHSDHIWLQNAFDYRLNYVVFHYLFIFMFGAYTAEKFDDVKNWLSRHSILLCTAYGISVLSMLAAYYGFILYKGYDPLSAVNTVHQLSPVGMVYTFFSMLFLVWLWECNPVPTWVHHMFSVLGNYSYPIYLVHPLVMFVITGFYHFLGITFTAVNIILTYIATVCSSTLVAVLLEKNKLPGPIRIALLGKK